MNKQSRRDFLKYAASASASAMALSILPSCRSPWQFRLQRKTPPNIILVITDDQGFADLGCHGNKIVKTPNLDAFADESVEFSQFYVCPVCAPTRACLMTGRYNYRTRVTDTYLGRAMMDPAEVTIAEALKNAGYATAIFGKWHLGDRYPMRTIDQGFQESIVHTGGFIGEKSGPPGNSYFNPILMHNGKEEHFDGYCMDIYTDKTIDFIQRNKNKPFFVYLATNTPHFPLQVSDQYADPYRTMGLNDKQARLYGMVTNIDDNFARLLKKLKELNLEDNTIVIFMTDNGPDLQAADRFTASLRGQKGYVYEGGIRVPFFIRWPAAVKGSGKIDRIAAHIDIMPTLLDACRLKNPKNVEIDGKSLMPLLYTENPDWPDRTLFFQWHRGDEPVPCRSFAARTQRYKLTQAIGSWSEEPVPPEQFQYELFDIINDPFEKHDISKENPLIFEKMKSDYINWYKKVSAERGYEPPFIIIGSKYENPTRLTHQDQRRARGCSLSDTVGHWNVKIAQPGRYDIKLSLYPHQKSAGQWCFQLGNVELQKDCETKINEYTFENIFLPKTEGRLEAWIDNYTEKTGVNFIDIKKRN